MDILSVRVESMGLLDIVNVQGEIDLASAQKLRNSLDALVGNGHHIIVKLNEVTYTEACGVRILAEAYARAKSLNQNLVLVAPSPMMRRVLKMVAFDQAIPIFDSIKDASA
jgi:anti-anti-sigma factor